MTQEEKHLLLVDLCTRLPYGVIVKYKSREKEGDVKITCGNIGYVTELGNGWWKECKPYLRSMSSMTESEKKKLGRISCEGSIEHKYGIVHRSQDYLNSIHVDYRGLIEKGLALEAPADMYKV